MRHSSYPGLRIRFFCILGRAKLNCIQIFGDISLPDVLYDADLNFFTMKYLIVFICLMFYMGVSAQSKKSLNIICDPGDIANGRQPSSTVGLDRNDPAHIGEAVWYTVFNGEQIFNFQWKRQEDSKLDLSKRLSVKSVNIKLDNDSLVVLLPGSPPRVLRQDFLWVQSKVSMDEIKQFSGHKLSAITLITTDNTQYPLVIFNEAEQRAIEAASKCFLYAIKK